MNPIFRMIEQMAEEGYWYCQGKGRHPIEDWESKCPICEKFKEISELARKSISI